MTIEKLQDQNFNLSPEFTEVINELAPIYQEMIESQKKTNHLEMIYVGTLESHAREFSKYSDDRKAIRILLKDYSEDQRKNYFAALMSHNKLMESGVKEYQALAENASPSALKALGRCSNTTTLYDTAKYHQKNGKLPSVRLIEMRGEGKVNDKFESRNQKQTQQTQPKNVVTDYIAPTPPPPPTEEEMEMIRASNLGNIDTLKLLKNNDGLSLINNGQTALGWRLSLESILAVVEQHLITHPERLVQFETVLQRHKQPVIEVEAQVSTESETPEQYRHRVLNSDYRTLTRQEQLDRSAICNNRF